MKLFLKLVHKFVSKYSTVDSAIMLFTNPFDSTRTLFVNKMYLSINGNVSSVQCPMSTVQCPNFLPYAGGA